MSSNVRPRSPVLTVLYVSAMVLGLAFTAASLAPFLDAQAWWIRAWDFPRIQLVILGVCAGLGWGALLYVRRKAQWWDGVGLAMVAAGLISQAVAIVPYTGLARLQVAHTHTDAPGAQADLSIAVANVLMDNRDYDATIEILREADPDVILALEVDASWVAALEELTDHRPHVISHPLGNTYGIWLASKHPFQREQVRFRNDSEVPSIEVTLDVDGRLVDFYGLHPPPPGPHGRPTSGLRDAELVQVARELAEIPRSRPTVVAGDLNDVAWSKTTRLFQRISGLLDPRRGRGTFSTYHAGIPIMRWPLDHMFVSEAFSLRALERLEPGGSDHFPIYIALDLDAPEVENPDEAAPETPDADDHERARELADPEN